MACRAWPIQKNSKLLTILCDLQKHKSTKIKSKTFWFQKLFSMCKKFSGFEVDQISSWFFWWIAGHSKDRSGSKCEIDIEGCVKMHPSSVVVDSYQDVVHCQEDNAFISFLFSSFLSFGIGCTRSETLPETTESGPLCITDLFQNVAYF